MHRPRFAECPNKEKLAERLKRRHLSLERERPSVQLDLDIDGQSNGQVARQGYRASGSGLGRFPILNYRERYHAMAASDD